MIDWMCRDATKFRCARTSLMSVSGGVTLGPFFTCQPGDKRCFMACGFDDFEHGSKLCLELQIHLTFNLFCSCQQTETEKNTLLSFFLVFFPPGLSDVLKVKNTASLSHPGASTCSPSELSHPSHPPVSVACIYSGLFTFNKTPNGESRGARWPQVGGMSTVWRGKCNQLRSAN